MQGATVGRGRPGREGSALNNQSITVQ